MDMEKYKDIKTFDELIELEHGKIGTESRNKYEEGAQMFIVSEMLKEARKEANLTQEQLAEKAGTNAAISGVETHVANTVAGTTVAITGTETKEVAGKEEDMNFHGSFLTLARKTASTSAQSSTL